MDAPHQTHQPPPPQQHPQTLQPPYQQQAQPAPRPRLRELGDVRRVFAATVDGVLPVCAGFAVAQAVAAEAEVAPWWGAMAGSALAVSFVNHVLLTLLIRGSVAKFAVGLRVVRDPVDDRLPVGGFRRPGFWRTVGRWGDGLLYWPKQPVLSVFGSDGDAAQDKLGVRVIRRGELVAAR